MTGVQTCALPICFPVTIGTAGEKRKKQKNARLHIRKGGVYNKMRGVSGKEITGTRMPLPRGKEKETRESSRERE